MSQAKCGDRVVIHYTGKLENGEVFTNSKVGDPFEFTIGKGEVIPGFENGVISMEVGETKTITVAPEEAYGPRSEELLIQIKKGFLPENITPAIGEQLQIPQKDGNPIDVTISDMDEDTVTLDANHPLAGTTVIFNVLLVGIT
jgi:peptidylprolyl isomerase